jgi:hypothetical protein
MHLYLYLEREEWAEAWTGGGVVPLNLASAYRSDVRQGVMTPDELKQQEVKGLAPNSRRAFTQMFGDGNFMNCSFKGNVWEDNTGIHLVEGFSTCNFEDALILCLSRARSRRLSEQMGKVVCVKIRDVDALRQVLEAQTGRGWSAGMMRYTEGPDRNHLLKHMSDCWQHEFRLFSTGNDIARCEVQLPPNIGEVVDMDMLPEGETDGSDINHRAFDQSAPTVRLPGLGGMPFAASVRS